jgi:hypothetical protein
MEKMIMTTKSEFAKLDETLNSDRFKKMLTQIEDRILEVGNLSELVGNETQISIFITREDYDIYTNIDLQTEDEINLDEDQIDAIGDLVMEKSSGLLSQLIRDTVKDCNEISILGNVTINGERPDV